MEQEDIASMKGEHKGQATARAGSVSTGYSNTVTNIIM